MSLRNILPLFVLLCAATAVHAQATKEKAEDAKLKTKPGAEAVVGVWRGKTATGEEYATFTADGRVILKNGPLEPMSLKYKLDVSSTPWKLDLSGTIQATPVVLYTVVDLPATGQFRMARPAIEAGKRPDAEALKAAPVLQRVTLEANAGIHQVTQAALKKVAGNWEGKDGGQTMTLTFTAEGAWSMKVAEVVVDKGRFRIDVSKVPLAVDLLSTEGTGVKYSIFEITPEGSLRTGRAAGNPEERPVKFEDASSRVFKRKADGGTGK